MQSRAAIRYAKAIFDIAKEENSIDGVFSDMHIINSLNNSSSEFKNLLSNSQINNGDKKKAILSLIENPSSLTIKLLDLLNIDSQKRDFDCLNYKNVLKKGHVFNKPLALFPRYEK